MFKIQNSSFDDPVGKACSTLTKSLHNVVTSNKYFVTPELSRELQHITTGVKHIDLDHKFLNNSQNWMKKFDKGMIRCEKSAVANVLDDVSTKLTVVQDRFNVIQLKPKQDNEVRIDHEEAKNNLHCLGKNIAPFAHQSIDRLNQFCDFVGLTDRFTGYRNNLNRSNFYPVSMKRPDSDAIRFNYRLTGEILKADNSSSGRTAQIQRGHQVTSNIGQLSATKDGTSLSQDRVEQCGVSTIYPGQSEYTDVYRVPTLSQPVNRHIINPPPLYDMSEFHLLPADYGKSSSEYQTSYEWPNGNKVTNLPKRRAKQPLISV